MSPQTSSRPWRRWSRPLAGVGFALSLLSAGPALAQGEVPELPPPPTVPAQPVLEAVPAPEPEPCQSVSHSNGRLASILCGPTQQPLRDGGFRFQHFTGTQTTYYEHGGVHEVLPLNDGVLDGLVEVYDPVGHLIERVIFRNGQKQESNVPPLPARPLPTPETVVAELPAGDREHRPLKADRDPEENVGVGIGLLANATLGRNTRGAILQLGPTLDMQFHLGPRFAFLLRAEFAHTVTLGVVVAMVKLGPLYEKIALSLLPQTLLARTRQKIS